MGWKWEDGKLQITITPTSDTHADVDVVWGDGPNQKATHSGVERKKLRAELADILAGYMK